MERKGLLLHMTQRTVSHEGELWLILETYLQKKIQEEEGSVTVIFSFSAGCNFCFRSLRMLEIRFQLDYSHVELKSIDEIKKSKCVPNRQCFNYMYAMQITRLGQKKNCNGFFGKTCNR